MKPFLILYFSAVGNTKSVAEQIKNVISEVPTELYSVEKFPQSFSIDNYSAVIIGTTTYHYAPSKPPRNLLANANP